MHDCGQAALFIFLPLSCLSISVVPSCQWRRPVFPPLPQCPAEHDGLAEPAGLADPQGGFFLPPPWTHAGILAESLAPDPVGCSPSETAWLLGGFG